MVYLFKAFVGEPGIAANLLESQGKTSKMTCVWGKASRIQLALQRSHLQKKLKIELGWDFQHDGQSFTRTPVDHGAAFLHY